MSDGYLSRTNEKIYFSQLHITALIKVDHAGSVNVAALEASYSESVVFHLVGVYTSFLREIAETYRLPAELVMDVSSLSECFTNKNMYSPELNEWQSLYDDSTSWLNQLLSRCQLYSYGSIDRRKNESESIIPVVNDSSDAEILLFKSWLELMQEVISRQRTTMVEW